MIKAPVPAGGGEPARSGRLGLVVVVTRRRQHLVLHWQRQEAADGPLAALVIGVEQLNRPRLGRLGGGARLLVAGRGRVAERPLPETAVAHRYVQIPGLRLELRQRRVIPVALREREESPALQDRDPVTRVAQR